MGDGGEGNSMKPQHKYVKYIISILDNTTCIFRKNK